jgi:hypothetical protein
MPLPTAQCWRYFQHSCAFSMLPHVRSKIESCCCCVQVHLPSPTAYNSVLEVNDSDHKPVQAQLTVALPWYQQQQLRSTSLTRLWQLAQLQASSSSSAAAAGSQQAWIGDGTVVLPLEPRQLLLHGSYVPSEVVVHNPLQDAAVCFAVCAGASGLPAWLEVVPACGVLRPGSAVRLVVRGSKGGSWGRPGGGLGCELRVAGVVEGSVDASSFPLGYLGSASAVNVVMH